MSEDPNFVPDFNFFPPEWYDALPNDWNNDWIRQHDEDARSREAIPPLLFRAWSRGSGGRAGIPGNTPTRMTPPGFLDPNVPRGRAPHTFLTPRQFLQMIVYHFSADRTIRQRTGHETLFMSYAASPRFAWEYVQNLGTVSKRQSPENARDAHISMIDTTRLGPDVIVYSLPKLAQLFERINLETRDKLMWLATCKGEFLVFGIVDADARPGILSSLPYSHINRVDKARLDGYDARYRSMAHFGVPPLNRLMRYWELMPLTHDLYPVVYSLIGAMPRLGILSACWMLALLCMARRSEDLLIEGDGACVPTILLQSIASEFQLHSRDIDGIVDIYERNGDEEHQDVLQLQRLATKLRDLLRSQEQNPTLPLPFYV